MVGAPTLLGLVSLAHPVVSPPIYPAILEHLPWWVRLHALNLALFPLFALAAWLLLQEVRKEARGLPLGQLITAGALIDAYWTSPTIQALAVFGSIAWVVGMLAAAVAFTAPDRRRPPGVVALLVLGVTCYARTRLFQVHGSTDIQPVWWLVTIATAVAMAAAARPRAAPALLVLAGALFGASHVPPPARWARLAFSSRPA